jgi:hypothetical protein
MLEVTNLMSSKLLDPELPVAVEAATSFPHIMQWKVAEAVITPKLQELFQIYINIMDKIDSEDLVDSFQSIIS